ncbi:daptide-type RiPP [Rathayibacter tanaceti]|uniref:Uncharacterized protein n=2 Tax=Rathayibacter tanaceti TaxID=1671680 RepID=A0ACD2XMJ3_9MICO|nr:daptide-type RiPP [Rathayibacter tanaceti]KZX19725.1 hypothetical protein ACH61_03178 [Rathayibacter tanaceti]TCO38366.1 hypothetical protein EV639_1023 [Rathayibacter tanaceti]
MLDLAVDEVETMDAPDSEFVAGFVTAVAIGGLIVAIT